TVRVGTGSGTRPTAAFGATGTLTGNIVVESDGLLSTHGQLGPTGTLTVIGDATFDGGTYAPNLGDGSDRLVVDGNVTLVGATLSGGFGEGALPGAPATVLDYTGTLTGTFANAPVGAGLIVGTDGVSVSEYGPPGTGVVLDPLPASPTPTRLTGV